jgi:hypothetical protein
MEKLRVYQLVQPDSVTEGMNLLARALVTLSDPAAKAEYDRSLGVGTLPPDVPERWGDSGESRKEEARPVEVEVLSLIPMEAEPEVHEPVVRPPTMTERAATPDWPPTMPVKFRPVRPPRERSASDVVRWVVQLRQLLEAWDQIGDWLAIPELTFATRREAVEVILALRRIRRLGPGVIDVTGPGAAVLKLAQADPLSSTLIELTDGQRQTLARDWRAGRVLIRDEYRRTRGRMNRNRRRFRLRPPWQRTLATWGLWFFGIAAVVIVIVRSWRGI